MEKVIGYLFRFVVIFVCYKQPWPGLNLDCLQSCECPDFSWCNLNYNTCGALQLSPGHFGWGTLPLLVSLVAAALLHVSHVDGHDKNTTTTSTSLSLSSARHGTAGRCRLLQFSGKYKAGEGLRHI